MVVGLGVNFPDGLRNIADRHWWNHSYSPHQGEMLFLSLQVRIPLEEALHHHTATKVEIRRRHPFKTAPSAKPLA